MTFLTNLILKSTYYGLTLIYPIFKAHHAFKENKVERLWILYFFLFGIFSILEGTALFPIKYLLSFISCSIWCFMKAILALWLIHPDFKGALFVEQKTKKFLDLAYDKGYGIFGDSVMTKLDFPKRSISSGNVEKTLNE